MLRKRVAAIALLFLPACATDPVASHQDLPFQGDTVVSNAVLDVGGASVNGLVWLAEDTVTYVGVSKGLHPTAVLVRDVGYAWWLQQVGRELRVRGWNAIVYQHRGTLTSPGTFALSRLQTDVDWLITGLRSEKAAESWGVARDRITLIGHFFGGGAALAAAARDPAVRCVAGLAAVNIGAVGHLAERSTEYRARTVKAVNSWITTSNPGDVPNVRLGVTPEQFVDTLIARADEFDVTLLAPGLAGRPVLLVGTATLELDVDTAMYLAPMRDALLKAGARVTDTVLTVRHSDFWTLEAVLVGVVKRWLLREHCAG